MAKKRSDGRLQKCFRVKGKRYVVYGHTPTELFEAEQSKRAEIAKGIEKRNNPTFNQYYEIWKEARVGQVSEATIRSQQKIINVVNQIEVPESGLFGDIKIRDITINDLRYIQRTLSINRKSQTVNDYMALVKHILADTAKERIIEYNPCVMLKNLKITEDKARDTIHRALTIDEQIKFFNCNDCKNSFYYNVFRLAINTGMRAGEIGALRITDIKNDMIYVNRTVTRNEIGQYILGAEAKTEAGRRVIPMNEQIKEIINNQKRNNQILHNRETTFDNLLFESREGGLLVATPIDRAIKKICQKISIDSFSMHSFRSTFATRCIENGMNPKTLQEILGHKNFNLTMSLYGHALTDTKKKAMDNLYIDLG